MRPFAISGKGSLEEGFYFSWILILKIKMVFKIKIRHENTAGVGLLSVSYSGRPAPGERDAAAHTWAPWEALQRTDSSGQTESLRLWVTHVRSRERRRLRRTSKRHT